MTGKKSRDLQKSAPLRLQYEKQRQCAKQSRTDQREMPTKPRPAVWRTIISGMVLVVAIAVKLLMPDVIGQYRNTILRLMGADTDFTETFSAVGRMIGEKNVKEVFENAYVAVFGESSIEDASQNDTDEQDRSDVVYDENNTPKQATMLQRILNFEYAAPVEGRLSSQFGYREHPLEEYEKFHYGLDIAAEEGTVIRAFADGTVTAIGDSSDLGKYVEVLHRDGYMTLYAHCSRITASCRQSVRMGDPIAEVGQTGETTGAHLHFAIYQDTLYLNPIYYVAC